MCPFFIIMRSCDILGTCTVHHSTKNDENFTEGVNSLASNVSINPMGAPPPPRAFVRHFQLYLFPGSGICFLLVSPGVGNLFSGKKSNICRLFRHLAVF